MLSLSINTFCSLLNDYLKRSFRLNENIVSLQPLYETNKTQPTNKIHLFLTNIERETGGGLKFNQQAISESHYKRGNPSWQLNLYILLAAVFSEKQYEESLQLLSGALFFLQNNNQFTLPQTNTTLAIEPINLSFHELSNLWGICGGAYYPSILLKIRTLNINSNEIKQIERTLQSVES